MRAILLAAGEGTRLRPYTQDRPKCMVELAGRPLIEWQRDALAEAGVHNLHLVTGYHPDWLRAYELPCWHNDRYAQTNMVASLMTAADLLDGSDDVLIAYTDIVYEPCVIRALLTCPASVCTTVDLDWQQLWSTRMADPLADAETLKLDRTGYLTELGRKPTRLSDIQGQYMGLILVRAHAARRWVDTYNRLDPAGPYDGKDRDHMYMTSFLQYLIDHGTGVRAACVHGGWLEVDSAADLELYRAMHADGRLTAFWSAGRTGLCEVG